MRRKRRNIRPWVELIVFCIIIGLIGGFIIKKTTQPQQEEPEVTEEVATEEVEKPAEEPEFIVYGSYDGKKMTEPSLDWGVGDLDFQPLDIPLDEKIQEFTFYLCAGYNIDWTFVLAIMQKESVYDDSIISKTNDYGLMQINVCNHESLEEILGISDFLDPYQNIRGGCYIIRKLFEKYEDPAMVLMAYNMGEDGASKLWQKGVYSTSYVEDILEIQSELLEQTERTGEQ